MDVFMREKIRNIVIITIIAIVVLFVPARLIYFRLYTGDRVNGALTLTIDSEEYSLDEKNISVEHNGQSYEFSLDDGEISLKGDDYGSYDIVISGLSDIPPITVGVFQANWWNTEDFELTIAADTKQRSVTYSGKHTFITEYGFIQSESISQKQGLSEKELKVGFGL